MVDEVGMKVGYLAPEITLSDENGNILNLTSLRGRIVLVEFWASWCSYCNSEIPELKKLFNDFQNKGFTIFAVSIDTDQQAWLDKLSYENFPWIQVNDPDGFSSVFAKQYEVKLIPRMVLVGETGHILLITDITDQVRSKLQQILN